MRIKGFVIGYVVMLFCFMGAAAGFCAWMSGREMLPEGFSLCGGVIGFLTLMYAFFVANYTYGIRQNASEAGNVAFTVDCVSHAGKKRGKRSTLAVCEYGFVVDSHKDGFKVLSYEDMGDCEILPFEVRVAFGRHMRYRFVFEKKLRSKAIADYLEKHMVVTA